MAVNIQLPSTIEEHLRRTVSDLDKVAAEVVLVELYRIGKLTHHELAVSLGLDRFQTDEVLKRHRVTEDLISSRELDEQLATLRGLSGK